MADNTNVILAVALVAGAYLYSQRATAATYTQQLPAGAVRTMPGSAGAGWQQVGINALAGFLTGALNGATPNVQRTYSPSQAVTDYMQSGTVQDVANPVGDMFAYWA